MHLPPHSSSRIKAGFLETGWEGVLLVESRSGVWATRLPECVGSHISRDLGLGETMLRREFIAIIGSVGVTLSRVVGAQNLVATRRIGVLMAFDENDPDGKSQLSGFVQELAELGWLVGRNLRMEVRWGGSDVSANRYFRERAARPPARPDSHARHSGDRRTSPTEDDSPDRIRGRHRPGRSWVRCEPRRARWEYHRVFDV